MAIHFSINMVRMCVFLFLVQLWWMETQKKIVSGNVKNQKISKKPLFKKKFEVLKKSMENFNFIESTIQLSNYRLVWTSVNI